MDLDPKESGQDPFKNLLFLRVRDQDFLSPKRSDQYPSPFSSTVTDQDSIHNKAARPLFPYRKRPPSLTSEIQDLSFIKEDKDFFSFIRRVQDPL